MLYEHSIRGKEEGRQSTPVWEQSQEDGMRWLLSAVTLSPRAKFGQWPLFVSTVLSEHSQAHSGHLSMVIFVPSWQHWVVATETVWPANPEYWLSGPSQEVCTSHTRLLTAPHAESFSSLNRCSCCCLHERCFQVLQWVFLVLLGSLVFTEGSGDPSSVLVSSLSVPYPFPSPQANSSFTCLAMRSLPNPHPLLEGTTWTQVW